MERLTVGPFSTRRLHLTGDPLPFEVDAATVMRLTGTSIEKLHAAGRLFFADPSYQSKYVTQSARYAAACSAYF